MSQEEKMGFRDANYSAWHRVKSLRRFVGVERAQTLTMIDVDAALYIECDEGDGKVPVALVETARDVGQRIKPATCIRHLARKASLQAFVVLYTVSDKPNPANPDVMDIESFRVRRIWPEPETTWFRLTPQRWAEALVRIRQRAGDEMDKAEREAS